jgi:hypothetical protein
LRAAIESASIPPLRVITGLSGLDDDRGPCNLHQTSCYNRAPFQHTVSGGLLISRARQPCAAVLAPGGQNKIRRSKEFGDSGAYSESLEEDFEEEEEEEEEAGVPEAETSEPATPAPPPPPAPKPAAPSGGGPKKPAAKKKAPAKKAPAKKKAPPKPAKKKAAKKPAKKKAAKKAARKPAKKAAKKKTKKGRR